jgi:hypothetical protein
MYSGECLNEEESGLGDFHQAVVFQNSNTVTMTQQLQVVQGTRDQVFVSRTLGIGKLCSVKTLVT